MSVNEFRRIMNHKRNGFKIEIFKAVKNYKVLEQIDTSKNNLLNCAHKGLNSILHNFEGVCNPNYLLAFEQREKLIMK